MIWNFSVVRLLIRSSASASRGARKRTFSEKCDMWCVPLCSRTEVCEKVRKVQSIESHHTFLPFSPDLATCVSVLFTKVKFKLDSWWFEFFGWNPVHSVVMQVRSAQKGPTVQRVLQMHIRRWPLKEGSAKLRSGMVLEVYRWSKFFHLRTDLWQTFPGSVCTEQGSIPEWHFVLCHTTSLANGWMAECLWHEHIFVLTNCKIYEAPLCGQPPVNKSFICKL